jgi:rSAM/selenodomain-associated transferase 1
MPFRVLAHRLVLRSGTMRRALIVIGKAPVPGLTKTRLVPPLSPDDAASLYRAFLLDTLALALGIGWEQTSLIHPQGDGPALRGLVPAGVQLIEQPGRGLGLALSEAFARQFAEGADTAVLIGSDNPTLPREPILAAQAALEKGSDVVLGPSHDGGYYLIGLRQPRPRLFDRIEWSTPRVHRQTLARTRELGLRVTSVQAWYDVDEAADLERLRDDLDTMPHDVATHTRVALEAIRAAPAR